MANRNIRVARELVRIAKMLVGKADEVDEDAEVNDYALADEIKEKNESMSDHVAFLFIYMGMCGTSSNKKKKIAELVKQYDGSKFDQEFFIRFIGYVSNDDIDIGWMRGADDLEAVQELWTCDRNNGPIDFRAYQNAFNHIQSRRFDRGMCRFFMKFSDNALYFMCRMGAVVDDDDVRYAVNHLYNDKLEDLLNYDTVSQKLHDAICEKLNGA